MKNLAGFDVIPDATGGADLTARPGMPDAAPDELLLVNNTAAAINIVLTPLLRPGQASSGNKTVAVPAQSSVCVEYPITAIVSSGTGAVSVHAYWYGFTSNTQYNSV